MHDDMLFNNGPKITSEKKRYATVRPYGMKDFYAWIRARADDQELEIPVNLNGEKWQLQIYSGATQVNFCKKDIHDLFPSVGNIIFDPYPTDEMIAGEIKFAKVYGARADYDNMISYSMAIEVDRINWTTALGPYGQEIHDIINQILRNR
ncbi:MAG: hypothetical protein NC548_13090 [Lachnospiraceae bacterium]|nr:hypothetical protein [Lachnospiraceae bacterium]MCM1230675.1 hypothetical protein [Ruminococcus flavefaciens]